MSVKAKQEWRQRVSAPPTAGCRNLTTAEAKQELIHKILEMEKLCFDEPWTTIHPDSICIAEDYGYVIGTTCELHRIAVLPQYRGQGLGYNLLQQFLQKTKTEIFLEVASKNISAIKLYKKCGFVELARRKGYYKDDDGIVMSING